jgi:fibro-slime domain-containing protein
MLTGTVRDFLDSHPDFEKTIASDLGLVQTVLGVDRKPVYAGGAGTATTQGQTAFDQWYRDVAGVNAAMPFSLTLDNTVTADSRIFSYSDSAFFPVDGILQGNQGRSHNFHFTYELHSEFTYTGGEVFSFRGDDDLWVFINRRLALDLGGVHGTLTGSVNLDGLASTLGITPGNKYDFDLFFAERHTNESTFRIDTSILLTNPTPEPNTVALLAAGLAAMGISVLRRRSR